MSRVDELLETFDITVTANPDPDPPEQEEQPPSSRLGQAYDSARFMLGNSAEMLERLSNQYGNVHQFVAWLEAKATADPAEQQAFMEKEGGKAISTVMDILGLLSGFEQAMAQADANLNAAVASMQRYDEEFKEE